MSYQESASGLLVPNDILSGKGKYFGTIIRDGEVIDEFEYENIVVNEGLNSNLNVYLGAASQITSWYMGVFQGNYTPVATDTAAVIAANSTECTAYVAGARQLYVPAAAASQSITNAASRCSFTFNNGSPITIYGAFLVSSATVSGTSGTLFSAARFGSAKTVTSGDQLLLTYAYTGSSV